MQAVVKLDSDFHLGIVGGRRPKTSRRTLEEPAEARIDRAYKKWQKLHQNYLTVCIMRRVLTST